MRKLLGLSVAAMTAFAVSVSTARADAKCDKLGAPGSARELSKACPQQVVQGGTAPEAAGSAGAASSEPGDRSVDAEAGYEGSGNPDPGYYVADPGESQFLVDTWTAGG